MKQTLFLLLFYFFSATAYSQSFTGRQSVSVGYAILPASSNAKLWMPGVQKGESNTPLNIFMRYTYPIDSRLAIGATTGIQGIVGTSYYYSGITEDDYKLTDKIFAGDIRYTYVSKAKYHIYSVLSLGVLVSSLQSNYPYYKGSIDYAFTPGNKLFASPPEFKPVTATTYTFQIDPFCLSFGRKLSGYIEIGYGYKGIVNAGANYNFGKKRK